MHSQCCEVKTLQLLFECQHGEQSNLFIEWFQLTSLRSPLQNGFINIYGIINNDKKTSPTKVKNFNKADSMNPITS